MTVGFYSLGKSCISKLKLDSELDLSKLSRRAWGALRVLEEPAPSNTRCTPSYLALCIGLGSWPLYVAIFQPDSWLESFKAGLSQVSSHINVTTAQTGNSPRLAPKKTMNFFPYIQHQPLLGFEVIISSIFCQYFLQQHWDQWMCNISI